MAAQAAAAGISAPANAIETHLQVASQKPAPAGWEGSDDFENLNPSCPRCNKWKSTYSLEHFRKVVQTSLVRLERDTPNYRLAKDYGLIIENNSPIVFYFEKNVVDL
jgi:hypothetical protein